VHYLQGVAGHELVTREQGGWRLTKRGKSAGIGFSALRRAVGAKGEGAEPPENAREPLGALEEQLRLAQRDRRVVGMHLNTPDGNLPWTVFVDQPLIGMSYLNPDILREALVTARRENAIVVASGLTAGDQSLRNKPARRALVPNFSHFEEQLPAAHALIKATGQPTLQLLSHFDRDTAASRTAAFFARELAVRASDGAPTLRTFVASVDRLDALQADKLRRQDPNLWQQIEQFVMHVVLPFEYLRGRTLRDVDTIEAASGLRMTEFDVLRDVVQLLRKGDEATVREHYGKILDEQDLGVLARVLNPQDRDLRETLHSIRDGAWLKVRNGSGEEALRVRLHADRAFSPLS
jgi:hypothetical protein